MEIVLALNLQTLKLVTPKLVQHTAGKLDHGALVLSLVVAVRKQELLFVNEVMAQLFQIATVQALNLQTLKLVIHNLAMLHVQSVTR